MNKAGILDDEIIDNPKAYIKHHTQLTIISFVLFSVLVIFQLYKASTTIFRWNYYNPYYVALLQLFILLVIINTYIN